MLVESAYSKWKRGVETCRPWSCIAMMLSRADTAPTEAMVAIFTLGYAARMLFLGPAYWSDAEYTYVAGLGISTIWWPWVLLGVGVNQTISLFSRYPLTKCSRMIRTWATSASAAVWGNNAIVHYVMIRHEPEWMFPAMLAFGCIWIVIRTRNIRDGR